MLVRIVKMSFEKKEIARFLENFELNKTKIREFEGCLFLELYRDKNNTDQFFTYSYWSDEEALEKYRNSKLFKKIWSETKTLFNQKPQAWSLDKLVSLE